MRAFSFEKICSSFGYLSRFNSGPVLGVSVTAASPTFWQPLCECIPDQSLLESVVRVLLDFSVVVAARNISVSYLL